VEFSGSKMLATSVTFMQLPKANNNPLSENSPNLVTLLPDPIHTDQT
jgi:hypothetical protein